MITTLLLQSPMNETITIAINCAHLTLIRDKNSLNNYIIDYLILTVKKPRLHVRMVTISIIEQKVYGHCMISAVSCNTSRFD